METGLEREPRYNTVRTQQPGCLSCPERNSGSELGKSCRLIHRWLEVVVTDFLTEIPQLVKSTGSLPSRSLWKASLWHGLSAVGAPGGEL